MLRQVSVMGRNIPLKDHDGFSTDWVLAYYRHVDPQELVGEIVAHDPVSLRAFYNTDDMVLVSLMSDAGAPHEYIMELFEWVRFKHQYAPRPEKHEWSREGF